MATTSNQIHTSQGGTLGAQPTSKAPRTAILRKRIDKRVSTLSGLRITEGLLVLEAMHLTVGGVWVSAGICGGAVVSACGRVWACVMLPGLMTREYPAELPMLPLPLL